METIHVILWVVIAINIASIVFNMIGGSSNKLVRKRFEQGTELANLATLAAVGKAIVSNPEIKEAVMKYPGFLDSVRKESEEMIKDSIERIYK